MPRFSNIKFEMRYYFLIITLFIFIGHPTWAGQTTAQACNAVETITSCPAGCTWDASLPAGERCTQCAANFYKTKKGSEKCTQCPAETYPYSLAGSTAQSDCFLKCSESGATIDNGSYLSSTKAQFNTQCTPTCQQPPAFPQDIWQCNFNCTNATNQCEGYHPENVNNTWKCMPNIQEINDSTLKVWGVGVMTDGVYAMQGIEYRRSCNDDYHLEDVNEICGHQVGTQCEQNSVSCSKRLSAEDNAWILGTAEYKNGAWDYRGCTRHLDVSDGDTKYTQKCPYQSGEFENTVWSTNCTNEIKSCGQDLCGYNGVCQRAPQGYYGNRNATCQPCPAGATSNAGAKSQSECFMQRGVTKFCDSTGQCFTLGGSGNIPHTPTTN